MKKRNNIYTTFILFLVMFLMAASENIKGVILPQVKVSFNINDTEISFILTMCSLAYIVVTLLTSKLTEKIGFKLSQATALFSILLACITIYSGSNYFSFLWGMILLNIGLAINGVVANVVLPFLFISYQAVLMNSMHFMYGMGATLGQRYAGKLLSFGLTFKDVHLYLALIIVLALTLLFFSKFPELKVTEIKEKNNESLFKNRIFIYYCLAIGFYVFSEIGLGNWLVLYLKSTLSINESEGVKYISTFFLLLGIGRLIGGFIVEKVGHYKIMTICAIIGSSLVALGLTLKGNNLYLISIAGLFYSIVFPTYMVTISNVFKSRSSYATSIILTFSSLLNMLLNQLIGVAFDNFGYNPVIYLIPASALIAAILFVLISIEAKKIKP